MRYIKITGGTGYAGTDFEDYLQNEMTDEQLNRYVIDCAYENAEGFDYMVYGWGCSVEEYAEENEISIEEAEGMMEEYYSEAYADWEEITEEEYKEATDIF